MRAHEPLYNIDSAAVSFAIVFDCHVTSIALSSKLLVSTVSYMVQPFIRTSSYSMPVFATLPIECVKPIEVSLKFDRNSQKLAEFVSISQN